MALKKERIVSINVRVPMARFRQIVAVTKAKGILNPTEFSRQAIYAAVDLEMKL